MNLPTLVYSVFVEMAVGGIFFLLMNDFRQDAPRGYMAFAGFLFFCFGGLAYSLHLYYPIDTNPTHNTAGLKIPFEQSQVWIDRAGSFLGWFLIALALYIFMIGVGTLIARRVVGSITLILALSSLVSLSLGYRGLDYGVATILSFLIGSLYVGAVTSGMFLGHWYLVDPGMDAQPLQRAINFFLFSIVLEVLLIAVTVPSNWNWALDPRGEVASSAQFWGLIAIGLIAPTGLGILIYKTCKMKSMQSATGLLYITMSLVLAGEILAKLIFFQTNVPI